MKKRKEILNVRMKKLKSRFENVFKFRYKSSENDELFNGVRTEDEDEKWQEVCGKKRVWTFHVYFVLQSRLKRRRNPS